MPTTPGITEPPLRFAIPNEPLAALALVSISEGLPAAHGVSVDPIATTCGARALSALIDGEYDLALTTDVALARRAFDSDALCVLATIGAGEDDSRVIARKSAGIATVADLEGRRIGTVHAGPPHAYLHLLLDRESIAPCGVDLVFLEPDEGAEGFRSGDLDVLATRPPLLDALIEELGADAVVFEAAIQPAKELLLVTRRDVLESRRPAIEALLAAFIAAEQTATDIDRVSDATAQWLGTTQEEAVRQLASAELQVRLDQAALVAIEQQARWIVSSPCFPDVTTATPLPNVLGLVDAGPLAAVDANRIGLLGWEAR